MSEYRVGNMTLTEAEARNAGLLPEQRKARFRRQADLLKTMGLQRTQEYRAFERAAK